MPIYKLATTQWFDSVLPRDGNMINPVLFDHGLTTNPQNLVNDWDTAFKAWAITGSSGQREVKCFDLEDPPPSPPKARKISNVGVTQTLAQPAEIACCLSFFAGTNTKRRRGRLYIPLGLITGAGAPGRRPSSAIMTKVGDLATILQNLGGTDVDWAVWSSVDQAAHSVTNWYVDDEWDIQRRRGGKPTTRITGTTSEAGLS